MKKNMTSADELTKTDRELKEFKEIIDGMKKLGIKPHQVGEFINIAIDKNLSYEEKIEKWIHIRNHAEISTQRPTNLKNEAKRDLKRI